MDREIRSSSPAISWFRARLIDSPSRLWWDIRPSALFPTLELRVTDVCSRLDYAISVAALLRQAAINDGATPEEAMLTVADFLIEEARSSL